MKKLLIKILCILALGMLSSCSFMKQNNWFTRNTHALNTRYNVYFNGRESYKEGIDAIAKSNVDDYTTVLPLYPISRHENAAAATAQMDRALEKSEKAIKEHSIRKKPKKKPARAKDPKYQAFMQREEYNSEIDKAWLLLGKAQFHKAEFLAAVGTFTYVVKHFSWKKDAVAEAQIWLAKSYAEMDWLFESDEALNDANRRPLPNKLTKDFAAARGDLLLKQRQYKAAILFVEVAAEKETKKKQRARFYYVLAQLYQLTGDNAKSYAYYTKTIRANSPFEMDFSARLNRAQVASGSQSEVLKPLKRMLRSSKYDEHQDKIYFAIAKIYQAQGDDEKAIENYLLALAKNKDDDAAKMRISVELADLYYTRSEYLKAQPHYAAATALMPLENPDYKRVSDRSQMLDELNQQHEIVVLQDSLQALARLSEDARREKIDQLIKRLQDEEAAQRKKEAEEAEAEAARQANAANAAVPAFGSSGDWYFYNPPLVASGKQDFRQRWGSRKLEDNWRRKNKTALMLDDDDAQTTPADDTALADAPQDGEQAANAAASSVNADPQFYLKQVPATEAQLQKSDEQIADALFNMGVIYKDDLEDLPMAIATFEELERRFPKDKRLPDTYFYLYQIASKKNDADKAELYRLQLVQRFPESTYAKVLSQPDYVEKIAQMNATQDSLYQASYFAYTKNDFSTVFQKYDDIKASYPLSPLMPKFMFLNALSKGKTGDTEALKTELETLIADYPQSDVSAMAKDILAYAKQGNEIQAGGTHGSILALRDSIALADATEKTDTTQFSPNRKEPHLIVIVVPAKVDINKLQFNVASYNFTGFLIKNFDLEIRKYNAATNLLIISALEDYDEALWYENDMKNVADIKPYFTDESCTSFVISATNFDLIKKGRSIEDYLTEIYHKPKIQEKIEEKPVEAPKPAEPEQKPTTQPEAPKPQVSEKPIAVSAPKVEPAPKAESPQPMATFNADPTAPHSFGILITKGTPDFDLLKDALERYNSANYPMVNLAITRTEMGDAQLISVGMLPDANAAKSYLFGVVRQRELFAALRGTDYRNVVISNENIGKLSQTRAFADYLRFNQETYMK